MSNLKTAVASLLNAISDNPDDYPDMAMHRMIHDRVQAVEQSLTERNRILAYVEGGNVQGARADEPEHVTFINFDVDNRIADGRSRKEIEEEWNEISKNTTAIY